MEHTKHMDTIKRVGDFIKSDTLGAGRISGYLVRFTEKGDTDLVGDYFNSNTQFMLKSHSIKGKPILLEHGLEDHFGLLPIGVFDFESVDDVGVWVEGKLADREDYERWLSEINYKGLSSEEISRTAEIACEAVKKLLSTGKAQFSSGALPQSVMRDDATGHIEQWVIVEGSVTYQPAEPNGTQIIYSQGENKMAKKMMDDASIDEEDKGMGYSDNVAKVLTQMKADMVAVIESVLDDLRPEEMQEVSDAIEEQLAEVAEDTKMVEDDEEENAKRVSKAIATRQDAIIASVAKFAKSEREKRKIRMVESARNAVKGVPVAKTRNVPAQISARGDYPFAHLVKSLHDRTHNKALNPYIGQLGGVLVGQTIADEILPPLRAESVAFQAGIKQTLIQNTGTYVLPRMVTAPEAYRPGINTTVVDSNALFDTVTAQMRPIAAQVIIPMQLMQTSPFRVEELLREQLIRSLQLAVDKEIFEGLGAVGSGTGQEIKGIFRTLTDSLPGNIESLGANGGVPSYQDLVGLETLLAEGNIPTNNTTAFVMHPRDRGTLRSLTDTVGQPLLRNNYGELAYQDVLGYPVLTSTALNKAVTTGSSTGTSRIYFGTFGFGEYVMSNDIEIMVDTVTLMNSLQVRVIAYTFSDFIIHYPEAFTVLTGVRAI